MANAYRIKVGMNVSYLAPPVVDPPIQPARWRSAKVTAVTDQNNLVLAYIGSDRIRVPINGGVAVPKRTNGT